MVDARLPDGSRVNAIIPPLALRGPSLTIRKFAGTRCSRRRPDRARHLTPSRRPTSSAHACAGSSTSSSPAVPAPARRRCSTLSRRSSRTTERIVTVEDAAELRLQQRHVVSLESRPPNIEGEGEVRIRDLVRNALRMRPDRIIVGEVRGGEALDMLQAMNTGHDGSLTTVHANSAARRAAPSRDAGADGRHRAADEGDPRADRRRLRPARAHLAGWWTARAA